MAKSLSDYRDQIVQLLIKDKDICETILDRTIDNMDDGDMQIALITENIFKYNYIPLIQDEEKTFITFDIRYSRTSKDSLYKNVSLTFWIYSHKNVIHTSERKLRPDLIQDRVQYLFNENEDIGLGKMYLTNDDLFRILPTYYGRVLTFIVKDQLTDSCR